MRGFVIFMRCLVVGWLPTAVAYGGVLILFRDHFDADALSLGYVFGAAIGVVVGHINAFLSMND